MIIDTICIKCMIKEQSELGLARLAVFSSLLTRLGCIRGGADRSLRP